MSAEELIERILTPRKQFLPLDVLGMEPNDAKFADVAKTFRRLALVLHPDKCKLPRATDALVQAEKAYAMLKVEAAFDRMRLVHLRFIAQELKEREDAEEGKCGGGGAASAAAAPAAAASGATMTKEQRIALARQDLAADDELRAAQAAREAEAKRARVERERALTAAKEAELKRLHDEYKGVDKLF